MKAKLLLFAVGATATLFAADASKIPPGGRSVSVQEAQASGSARAVAGELTLTAEALAQKWQSAWNRHDMDALAALTTEDVEFVNVGGRWLRGRADFREHHAELHQVTFAESTWTTRHVKVKLLRPEVAIAHIEWSLKGDRNRDGTAREPRDGIFTWVLVKSGERWLIAAAHNTNNTTPVRYGPGDRPK
jgi:uncharacterized protein (TIGR02246 family)